MDSPPDVYFWMLSIGIKLLQTSLICLKGVPSRRKQAVLSAQISRWASSHSMWGFNIVLYFTSSLYGIMTLMQFTCQPMRTDVVCWCMAMMQFTCTDGCRLLVYGNNAAYLSTYEDGCRLLLIALMQFTCQPMRTDVVCWCVALMQCTCQPMRTDAGC